MGTRVRTKKGQQRRRGCKHRLTVFILLIAVLALVFSTGAKCGSDWDPGPQPKGEVVKRVDNPERNRATLHVEFEEKDGSKVVVPYRRDISTPCQVGDTYPDCDK